MAIKASAVVATSSAPLLRPHPSLHSKLHQDRHPRRPFATAPDADPSHPPWPRSAHPTPYEILGLPRGAAYTKTAYYRLAKIYHPDSHCHSSHPCPEATRLERYRLLVAAHQLLSDPARRRLYDDAGLGWAHAQHHRSPTLREMDRDWRSRPGSAANNATWEDWQRWREGNRGAKETSGPVYMPHGRFAALVVALCAVGWAAQLGRAESAGDRYAAWVAEQNAHIGGRLMAEGAEAAGRSRDQRVDEFLKERENMLYKYEPAKYDKR